MPESKRLDFKASMELMKEAVREMVKNGVPLDEAVTGFKTFYTITAVEMCKGNKQQASRLIGLHRNTMRRHLPDSMVRKPGHGQPCEALIKAVKRA